MSPRGRIASAFARVAAVLAELRGWARAEDYIRAGCLAEALGVGELVADFAADANHFDEGRAVARRWRGVPRWLSGARFGSPLHARLGIALEALARASGAARPS